MDKNKPPIDFERLKEIQAQKNKKETPPVVETTGRAEAWVLTETGWVRRSALDNPYYNPHLIDPRDWDEYD